MDKKNKLILIFLVLLTLIVVGICTYAVINNNKKNDTDAIKFRNEYTELNGKTNEANGKNYVNVVISDTNTVKYINEKKAVELLEKGTGIIYFGFSTCPWCRSLVSTLTKIAEAKNETVYYLDVLDIRSAFEINEGKLNKIKDGTKGYYEILDLLKEELEDFYLIDEAGNKFDTQEKRLYAPTLVAVNKGKVTGIHVGTIDSQESGYDELTESQLKELEGIVEKLIVSKDVEVCTSEKC